MISEWNIELSEDKSLRQFDYSTITDVIMHIKYTAREDAGDFKTMAIKSLKTRIGAEGGLKTSRLFSLKHDFPEQFQKLKNAPANQSEQVEIQVLKKHFPYICSQGEISIQGTTMWKLIKKEFILAENDIKLSAKDGSTSPIQAWMVELESTDNITVIEDILINMRYWMEFPKDEG